MDSKNKNFVWRAQLPGPWELRAVVWGYRFWQALTALFLATGLVFVASRLYERQSLLPVLSTANWLWLGFLALIGLLFWRYRLRGLKPSDFKGIIPVSQILSWDAKKIYWRALRVAFRYRQVELSTVHLLLALFGSPAFRLVLMRLGIPGGTLRELLVRFLRVQSRETELRLQPKVREILEKAALLATNENNQINWSHLAKAALEKDPILVSLLDKGKISFAEASGVVDWTFHQLSRGLSKQRSSFLRGLWGPRRNLNRAWTARPTPILDRFSQNLTELAKLGFLTSARVRQKEVQETIRILARSRENSVVLVGEAGVGKTSIVGDLALKIVHGTVPILGDKKLIALDIARIAGTGSRFQSVFARAIKEAASAGNVILFIGNLDQLGKAQAESGFDLAGILLDAISSKGFQLIGTSTPLNYKRYIENNKTLSPYFAKVTVEELPPEKAILVLEDLSYQIENKQGVLVTLSAIKAAVGLSVRLIHDRYLPDKALELLDEAAVYASRAGRKIVGKADVEAVMSFKTNVPIAEATASEKEKLSNLENKLHERLIDQGEAVKAVAEALRRARLGVRASVKRPIGSFLFLGPTGVGKTELAKTLAWAYFGDAEKMVRLDMSEYQTPASIERLLGPPASAGRTALSGGQFTEAVKNMPFAVVLLDEIEKAHPDILNTFLQVLDEGHLTDSLGNKVDFTHTIIIATSNAQARLIQEGVRAGEPYASLQKKLVEKLRQENFRPEFLNRFDGVIVFKPLGMKEIEQIAELKINKLEEHLKAAKDLILEVKPAAVTALAKAGYDPAFGARPLERVIREKVENKVAQAVLNSKEPVKRVVVEARDIES